MNGIKPKPLPEIPEYGENAIEVKNLTFSYNPMEGSSPEKAEECTVLRDLNLTLSTGSRCLLIGANGAGKSTLLRIVSGRHLTRGGGDSTVRVLGLDSFHDTRLNFHRAYLDCDWGMRSVAFHGSVPMMADIPVHKMMERLQASYPERRDELVEMLGIDLEWRMNQLSDGQRRRVQILLGLVRPFKILLLDEITTSLDVCVRQDLLRWLVRESDERGATIIYATHIFDGLDDWGTHLFFLTNRGACGWQGRLQDLDYYKKLQAENHPAKMLAVAENWLRAEVVENRRLKRYEKANGPSTLERDVTGRSQGGYASGRMETDEEKEARLRRHGRAAGRLSDVTGNSGVMQKVHRVGY